VILDIISDTGPMLINLLQPLKSNALGSIHRLCGMTLKFYLTSLRN